MGHHFALVNFGKWLIEYVCARVTHNDSGVELFQCNLCDHLTLRYDFNPGDMMSFDVFD